MGTLPDNESGWNFGTTVEVAWDAKIKIPTVGEPAFSLTLPL